MHWRCGSPRLLAADLFQYRASGFKRTHSTLGCQPEHGYLIFTSDGGMMVLVTAKTREPGNTDEKMAALLRTVMAYTGRYRIDEDRFITKIDSSWNEAWNGSEQKRFYKLDGDTLEVSTAWIPNPLVSGNPIGRAILSFRRE
ncbi:MAG: lipocalin-like domain-containing protein [Pseudomonadota bacterium]|nr:lipocalin-like domain-containing protein [Pseudomonadota bacterium]